MIRHIVLWKVSPSVAANEEERESIVTQLSQALVDLVGVVPTIKNLSAGPNVVGAEGNWDFGLVADFDDEDALDEYQTHPSHQAVVAQIKAVVSERAAIDLAF